jgi:hypothetical protein
MMQATFGAVVGLEAIMPIAHHPNDWVRCEDTNGWTRRSDCIEAVDGSNWLETEARNEHEEQIVKDYFDDIIKWSDEYHASSDCVNEYAYLVWENIEGLRARIKRVLEDEFYDYTKCDFLTDEVLNDFCTALEDHVECKAVSGYYDPFEVTFDSFDFGESEEQIDINGNELLHDLHERGDLEGYLDSLDCDFCFHRDSIRVCNDAGEFVRWDSGCFIRTDFDGKHPYIYLSNNTGLWYHYGCSSETFRTAWNEFAEENDLIAISA